MSVRWNDRYEHQHVAALLESTRIIGGDGRGLFQGFAFKECSALVYDLLTFQPEIPETEGRAIVNRAILAVGALGPTTPDSILREVKRRYSNYLRRRKTTYYLASSMSLNRAFVPQDLQLRGARIKFGTVHPPAYTRSRASLKGRAEDALMANLPSDYMPFRIRIKARSPYEAADEALDTIDELRGLWNLFFNRQRAIRISLGSKEPINTILLGPLHSLHKPRGELATETFWYELSYRAPVRVVHLGRRYTQLVQFYSNLQGLLRRSHYRTEMRNAIVRYARALDDRDWHASYLRLWGVLENLTAMGRKGNYDVLVRRSAGVFREFEYMREVLNVLRDQRNRVVHASSISEEIETYLYQLKRCVEGLIEFHLGNSFRFKSIQQATEFLDLPPARHDLDHKARLIEYAQQYRGYKPRDPD